MFLIKCVVFILIANIIRGQKEIITGDNLIYKFFPVKGTSVSFKVDAHNDACVALSKHPRLSVPMYELVIGGWGNTKSVIRRKTCLPREKDEVLTPKILSDQEFRGFWIRWDNGLILVGREGEDSPFMSWQDPKPFDVKYAGLRTKWGSDGNWRIANGTRNNGGNENDIYVATKNDAEAQYLPVSGKAVHFNVRARNDVIIDLNSKPRHTDPMYQIVIGGWSNSKSVIRKYVCHIAEKDQRQTPQILDDKGFREFWLRWDHGNVLIGREGEAQPFLAWQDPEPVRVAYVGVRTTWGSTGNWKIASGSNKGEERIDVRTENDVKWQFFPIPGDSLKIKVQASNDATIGLATHPWETDPMYEIVLGGWGNTKSVLRRFCCLNPDRATVETEKFLKSGDLRGFWVRWDGGNLMAGKEGETTPFISWRDPEPFPVAYLGVHTGHGSTGVWQFDNISTQDVVAHKQTEHVFAPAVCAPTLTRLRHGTACAGQTVFEENFDTLREDVWQVQQYVPVDHPVNISTQDVVAHKQTEHVFAPAVCAPTLTRLRHGTACAGQTVFEENFDTLREDVWQVQQYVPVDHPELPFVSYQPSTVSVKNGNLRIAPTLQQNQPGFTHSSMFDSLDLYEGCTSGQSNSCFIEASDGSSVLPPIVSGRIISRSSFAFTYGTISVRAKLPKGDWIYPEILLESFSKKFVYGTKNSGMLKIACSRGNKVLRDGSTQYGNTVMYSGPVIDTKCHDTLLASKNADKNWGDDFHVYSVKWTPEHLTLSVDGEEYARVEPGNDGLRSKLPETCSGPNQPGVAPFDDHFYITLGVAAGGHSEFPDECVTDNNHKKPWKNHGSKAVLHFWNDIDAWQDTWERPELLIDYVKVVAL